MASDPILVGISFGKPAGDHCQLRALNLMLRNTHLKLGVS